MSQVLKRYAKMVRPLMFFKGRKENLQSHRQPYSFSGNLSWRNKQELRGRRGEYSAPASMRTSPSNSGLLLATTALLVIAPWKSCRLLFKQQLLIARTQLLQKKRSNVKCYITYIGLPVFPSFNFYHYSLYIPVYKSR
jgi:hypothetical protein